MTAVEPEIGRTIGVEGFARVVAGVFRTRWEELLPFVDKPAEPGK